MNVARVGVEGDTARAVAALAMSLGVHAVMLALLPARGAVTLTLVPTSVRVTFLEASDRDAGPGTLSRILTSAGASVSAAPPPPEQSKPEDRPEPAAVVPPRARQKVAKKVTTSISAPSSPAPPNATTSSTAADGDGGVGRDAHSSAPEWANTVRVRYEEQLFAWMNRHKEYPMLAQRRGIEGSGALRVRIDRDGRVLERSLERSTGQPMLDQAALDMVRRASPYPAVPAAYAGASFEFVAPIEYRLR